MKTHLSRALLPLLVLTALPALMSGCKSPCEKLYAKMSECAGEKFDMKKEDFVKECDKDKDKEEAKGMIACADESSCGAFATCTEKLFAAQSEKFAKERLADDVKEVRAAIDAKKFDDKPTACYGAEGDDKKELADACGDFYKGAYAHLSEVMAKARDEMKVDDATRSQCYRLPEYAEAVSADAKGQAEKLCEEVRTAEYAAQARAEAQKNIESKTLQIPVTCDMQIEALETLATEWSKKTADSLAQTCYGELGKLLLADKVGSMTYCEYQVKKVYDAVKKRGLKGGELDPLMAQAEAKCAAE